MTLIKLTKKLESMNKSELILRVAEATGQSKHISGDVVNAAFNIITDSLKTGDKITLSGFGIFSTIERSARTGRNPQTGDAVEIPAKKQVRFRAGKEMHNQLN